MSTNQESLLLEKNSSNQAKGPEAKRCIRSTEVFKSGHEYNTYPPLTVNQITRREIFLPLVTNKTSPQDDRAMHMSHSLVTRGMVSASRVYSFNLSQANHFVSRREWGIGWRDGVLVQYVYRFQYVRGSSLDLAQCRHRFKPYCCNTLSLSTRSFNRSGCHGFITATFAIASFFAEICTGYLEFLMTKSHQGERERNDLCIRTLYMPINNHSIQDMATRARTKVSYFPPVREPPMEKKKKQKNKKSAKEMARLPLPQRQMQG
ncbi:hypothetical protein AFLA_008775 [Aspergillus flavus NRRL3357]|nr:hypothetical protein AFLA_008775 [Aspergillus flavus NRRL3357]